MDSRQAELLFNKTAGSSIRALRLIGSLRECLRHGLPLAYERLFEDMRRVAEEHISKKDFGTDDQRVEEMRTLTGKVEHATSNTIDDAVMTADAACIVFAHSMVDGAVENYCAVSAALEPKDWLAAVKGEKITIEESRASDQEKVLREHVTRYLNKLRRESLLTKIQNLQKACQPGKAEIRKGYVFDAERIERIDRLRHGIVHETFGEPITMVDEDLEYLEQTQFYLSQLITHRYGLKLGPELFVEAQR